MKLVATTDERLYEPCRLVIEPTALSLKMLRDRMAKLMVQKKGIGLVANQVGRPIAMFIMKKDNKIITCINPSISWQSDAVVEMKEGCLSFPKEWLLIYRPAKIIASYTNLKGEHILEKMEGIEARCFQHELNHLSGITFISLYHAQQQVSKH